MAGAASLLYRRLCCHRRQWAATESNARSAVSLLDEKQALADNQEQPLDVPMVAAAQLAEELVAQAAEPAEAPAALADNRRSEQAAEPAEAPATLADNRRSEQAIEEQPPADPVASHGDRPAEEGNWPAPSLQEQHAFLDAAKYFNFRRVRELVSANPRLVNVQPARRWSALHQAALFGDPGAVRFLLDHGADIRAKTRDGLTPLEVASPGVFDLLLEATLGGAEETNGPAGPKTSDETIAGLHVWRFGPQRRAEDGCEFQCLVCLQDVAEGDELRSLPCAHFFHTGCIDVWLRERSSSCPTCRSEVV